MQQVICTSSSQLQLIQDNIIPRVQHSKLLSTEIVELSEYQLNLAILGSQIGIRITSLPLISLQLRELFPPPTCLSTTSRL